MHIMIGKVPTLPGFTEGDRVIGDNANDDKLVDLLMKIKEVISKIWIREKIKACTEQSQLSCKHYYFKEENKLYIQIKSS